MNLAFAMAVYHDGGLLFGKESALIFFFAGIASCADPLMRLIYHQFNKSLSEIPIEKGEDGDLPKNGGKWWKLLEILSIGAWLPFFIIIATILKALDIIIIYHLILNGLILCGTLLISIMKSYQLNNIYQKK